MEQKKLVTHLGGGTGKGRRLDFLYHPLTELTYRMGSKLKHLLPPEDLNVEDCIALGVIMFPVSMGVTGKVAEDYRGMKRMEAEVAAGKADQQDVEKYQDEMGYRLMRDMVSQLENVQVIRSDGEDPEELAHVRTREEYDGIPISFVTAVALEIGEILEETTGVTEKEEREGK